MKNSFIYDAAIADKLDRQEIGCDRVELGGFFDSLVRNRPFSKKDSYKVVFKPCCLWGK